MRRTELPTNTAAVCADYQSGRSAEAVGRKHGISQYQVLRALEAEGIPPRRPGRQVTYSTTVIADVARRYTAGESSAALAKEFGVCKPTILHYVRRAGLTLKRPGAQVALPADAASVAAAYQSGQPVSAISYRTHLPADTVVAMLAIAGVTMRKRGRKPQSLFC